MPGPPIMPDPVSAYTFDFAIGDPANALYVAPGSYPFGMQAPSAQLHIVLANGESLGAIELGGEYDIEIRRKA